MNSKKQEVGDLREDLLPQKQKRGRLLKIFKAFLLASSIVAALAAPCPGVGKQVLAPSSTMLIRMNSSMNSTLAVSNDCIAEHQTGGTCFFTECDSTYRGESIRCVRSEIGWAGCECKGTAPCAHIDGRCYPYPDPKEALQSFLRVETVWILLFLFIPLGRSGMQTALVDCLGLGHAMSSFRTIETSFDFGKSYYELQEEQEFPTDCPHKAWVAGAFKFFGLHQGQVLFCGASYYAYKGFMGPWQFTFATCAIFKEVWYWVLQWWALFESPNFLMMVPFSEQDQQLVLMYFLNPDLFLSCCISQTVPTKDKGNGGLNGFTSIVSGVGANCAILAMVIGLVGEGAMFPSLFIGYLMEASAAYIFYYLGMKFFRILVDVFKWVRVEYLMFFLVMIIVVTSGYFVYRDVASH